MNFNGVSGSDPAGIAKSLRNSQQKRDKATFAFATMLSDSMFYIPKKGRLARGELS